MARNRQAREMAHPMFDTTISAFSSSSDNCDTKRVLNFYTDKVN